MKTTVIHHSADYDGIFCREIARKFLPDAELIGWDFGDKPLEIPSGPIYILDLPVDRVFGFDYKVVGNQQGPKHPPGLVWIDHHKSSIETHPTDIPGYRIDGVAACRLAWQWFNGPATHKFNPDAVTKQDFIERKVREPLAVRLAGEYDIWDHRGDGDVEFQFGLDAQGDRQDFSILLSPDGNKYVGEILHCGYAAMNCYAKRDADVMRSRSFLVDWEGLKFLCLNTARCNSNTFNARDIPATGHDALMAFYFNGREYSFSLYHAAHRKDLDLSLIASKHGGGGHRGACGFQINKLPF